LDKPDPEDGWHFKPHFNVALLIPSLNDTMGKSWEDLVYVRSYIIAAI